MLLLAHIMLLNFSVISKTFFYSSRLYTYLEVAVPMMLPLPPFNNVTYCEAGESKFASIKIIILW